jgi:hypothetical protein
VTWSALIPGLREIRGPLLAGYLWILAIWLLLGDRLPSNESGEVFERLWEAGEAVGPIGRAAALSVVAYLIGALVTSAIRSSVRFLFTMAKLWSYQRRSELPDRSDEGGSTWLPVSELLKTPDADWEKFFTGPNTTVIMAMVRNLEQTELNGARAGVEGAVRHAEDVSAGSARYMLAARRGDAVLIAVPRPDRDLVELQLPMFSPYQDILAKRSLLKTRLRELVPPTATKIEQIDYEAEFRESIIAPLAALALIVGLNVSLAWCALLIVPFALLLQAHNLRNAATKELIDALRARSGTEDLEKITPIFQIYRTNAKQLEEALIHANWNGFEYPDGAGIETRNLRQ